MKRYRLSSRSSIKISNIPTQQRQYHRPLTICVKARVSHAPGMPGAFSPPPTSKVKDPGMSGSLTCGSGENVPCIPGSCASRNFTCLVRGPWWPSDARCYSDTELHLGLLYSISGRTSYRKISWSLEAARLDVIMIVSLWDVTGISAALPKVPVKFYSDWKSLNSNIAASRLREILR